METTRFLDLDCVCLKNGSIELLVTRSVGPRILRLSFLGGENLLANSMAVALDCPGKEEKFRIYGGHRLWHAPQVGQRTYLPDNQPVLIQEIAHGLAVIQPVEAEIGTQKAMRITLPDAGPTVVVEHKITNVGLWTIETAPWAITQLRAGGVAILPQQTDDDDSEGVWPNRTIALWPFTDINSPHIRWGNRFIFVHANMSADWLKFGFPNPAGWLAYWHDKTLFVKRTTYAGHAAYFDRGSSSQVFCMTGVIELETVGPKTAIAPGESVTHCETWSLYGDIEFEANEDAAQALVAQLKIG